MRHTVGMQRHRTAVGALLLSLLAALTGCGGEEKETLTVLAAASLTDVFEDLATEFEATHDGTTVEFSFGSSTTLTSPSSTTNIDCPSSACRTIVSPPP